MPQDLRSKIESMTAEQAGIGVDPDAQDLPWWVQLGEFDVNDLGCMDDAARVLGPAAVLGPAIRIDHRFAAEANDEKFSSLIILASFEDEPVVALELSLTQLRPLAAGGGWTGCVLTLTERLKGAVPQHWLS